MFCSECGTEIAAEVKFCSKCGTVQPIDIVASAPTSANKVVAKAGFKIQKWMYGAVGVVILGLVASLWSSKPSMSFLETVLKNRWSMKLGMPCNLNGGAYVVYDKVYGKTYTIQGQPQFVKKLPIVKIEEINATTIAMQIDRYGTTELENMLRERDVIAGREELVIRNIGKDRIEETQTLTSLDLDSAMRGQKRYVKEQPQAGIQEICK
jgi:hypothetical protein